MQNTVLFSMSSIKLEGILTTAFKSSSPFDLLPKVVFSFQTQASIESSLCPLDFTIVLDIFSD